MPKLHFRLWHMFAAVGVLATVLYLFSPDRTANDEEVINSLVSQGAFHLEAQANEQGRVVHLSFSRTIFEDYWLPGIRKLNALQSLDLRGHRIEPYGFDELLKMPLKHLDLRDTNLTQSQIDAFQARHPSCQIEYSYREFADWEEYILFREMLKHGSLDEE